VCEVNGHFVQAAILWRRIGETHNAIQCENIVAAMAVNERLRLIEDNPVLIQFDSIQIAR
jgi:hypothetical protein